MHLSSTIGELTAQAAYIRSHTPMNIKAEDRWKAIDAAINRIRIKEDKKRGKADAAIVMSNLAELIGS